MLAVDVSLLSVPAVNKGNANTQSVAIVATYMSLLCITGSLVSSVLLVRQISSMDALEKVVGTYCYLSIVAHANKYLLGWIHAKNDLLERRDYHSWYNLQFAWCTSDLGVSLIWFDLLMLINVLITWYRMCFFALALFFVIFQTTDTASLSVMILGTITITGVISLPSWWGRDYGSWWGRDYRSWFSVLNCRSQQNSAGQLQQV